MQVSSDRELVDAVRAGDRDAFGVLLERHHAAVYRLCYRMTGNVPDAEDLCHQAFVEAYLKLGQLRDAERFGGWLRTLVLNLCRMWYRRRRRERAAQATAPDPAAPAPESGAQADGRLSWGLTRLPAPQRLILLLHYLEGFSYKELADFLGVPMGTVMSRLHRARAALREAMNDLPENDEMPLASTEELKGDVDAELALLLGMFQEKPEAAQRLSVVLQRTPQRLLTLLESADEPALDALGRLLPRLGTPALRVVLGACGSDAADVRARVGGLLDRSVAQCGPRGRHGSSSGCMPPRYLYLLLDALFDAVLPPSEKAELLERWLDLAGDDASAALLASALLCFVDEAFPRLWRRFLAVRDPEELFRTPDVLYTLVRTGRRFAEALLEPLSSEDDRLVRLAIAGAEGLARAFEPEWLRDASAEQFLDDRRTRRKWAPLRGDDLPADTREALLDAVAAHVAHPEAAVRDAALRVLGTFGARRHADKVRAATEHAAVSTRIVALLALGELGDAGDAERVAYALDAADAPVRRAAVDVLARLRSEGAAELIASRLDDPDLQVRRAAVVALGGFDEARERLQAIVRGGDRDLVRAAAETLHRGVRPAPKVLDVTLRRKERAGLIAEPFTRISIDAAMRFALPEWRPYEHREITERLARVCSDYSATRRYMIEEGVLRRNADTYEPTELGGAVWRVEHRIMDQYLTSPGE